MLVFRKKIQNKNIKTHLLAFCPLTEAGNVNKNESTSKQKTGGSAHA